MPSEIQLSYTFIVRLWREKSDGHFIWRGSVDWIQGSKRVYFQNTEKLGEVIAQLAGTKIEEEAPEDREQH